MSKFVLHCPHINPDGRKCDNIIMHYDEKTVLSGPCYCRKCKTEWQAVIANGKVYEIIENVKQSDYPSTYDSRGGLYSR